MISFINRILEYYRNESNSDSDPATIIKPRSGWQVIDFKELKEYRDLIYFLVWRDIKVLYAQTIFGLMWTILQPLIQILIFTVVFSHAYLNYSRLFQLR